MKLKNRVLIFLFAFALPFLNLGGAGAMGSGNSYVDAQTGLTYSLYKPINTLGLTQSKIQLLICGGGGEQWVYSSFSKSAKKIEIMQTMDGAHCSDPGLSVKLPDAKINGVTAKAFVYCDPTKVKSAKKCGQAQVVTYGGYLLFTLTGNFGLKATTIQVQVSKGLSYSQLLAVAKSMTPAAPSPTPTPATSPTPTPTATVTPESGPISACKLPKADSRGDVSIGGWPRINDRMRTTGTVTAQVIFVDFPDAVAKMSPEEAFSKISGATDTFNEMSYGRMKYKLVPNYKWYRMKSNSTTYAPLNKSFLSHRAYISEALTMADPEVDFSNSDAFIIIANPDSTGIGDSGPGFASTNGNGFTLDGKYIANGATSSHDLNGWKSIWLNHEVTHTMGLVDFYAATPGGGSDYWDWHRYVGQFSYMGYSSFDSNAPGLMAYERWYLDWLDDPQIICTPKNETEYLITPLEVSDGVKAVMIPLSSTKEIVIESRRAIGLDKKLKKSGALVYVIDSTKSSGMGPAQIYPIDLKADPLYLLAPRSKGESVIVEGYTITVVASSDKGDVVTVKKN